MRIHILKNIKFVLFFLYSINFSAQEVQPSFPGGPGEMYNFISKNLQYPYISKKNGVYGKVYIKFEIKENGEVEFVKITKHLDAECDAEAIRIIKMMPLWSPGSIDGKEVPVMFTLPVNFRQESEASFLTESNYKKGIQLYNENNHNEALKYFENIPNEFQKKQEIIILKATSLIKVNRAPEGCKLLKKIRKENKEAADLYSSNCI